MFLALYGANLALLFVGSSWAGARRDGGLWVGASALVDGKAGKGFRPCAGALQLAGRQLFHVVPALLLGRGWSMVMKKLSGSVGMVQPARRRDWAMRRAASCSWMARAIFSGLPYWES
ncbi:MAG: hypothetical protein P8Y13_14195 [Deinococcales bacterium]